MSTSEKSRVMRLNEAYKYLYSKGIVHSIRELADAMGKARPSVSRALSGADGYVTEKFLSTFCGTFPCISSTWLLTGEGEMLAPQPMAGSVSVSPDLLERLYAELHSLRQEVADLRQEVAALRPVDDHFIDVNKMMAGKGVNNYNYAPSLSMVADDNN